MRPIHRLNRNGIYGHNDNVFNFLKPKYLFKRMVLSRTNYEETINTMRHRELDYKDKLRQKDFHRRALLNLPYRLHFNSIVILIVCILSLCGYIYNWSKLVNGIITFVVPICSMITFFAINFYAALLYWKHDHSGIGQFIQSTFYPEIKLNNRIEEYNTRFMF
jgi:uncharacterized membrane protein YkgB